MSLGKTRERMKTHMRWKGGAAVGSAERRLFLVHPRAWRTCEKSTAALVSFPIEASASAAACKAQRRATQSSAQRCCVSIELERMPGRPGCRIVEPVPQLAAAVQSLRRSTAHQQQVRVPRKEPLFHRAEVPAGGFVLERGRGGVAVHLEGGGARGERSAAAGVHAT